MCFIAWSGFKMKLQVSTKVIESKISAQQKKFQRLSQKVEQEKVRLVQWQEAQKQINNRAMQEIVPTYEKLRQISFQKIEYLVKHKKQKMTKAQSARLDEKVEQLAFELLHSQEITATQTKFLIDLLSELGHHFEQDIFDRSNVHFQQSHTTEIDEESDNQDSMQVELEHLKALLSDQHNLEADFFDFEADSPDDFMEKFSQKMDEREKRDFLDQFEDHERQHFEREIAREKAKKEKKIQQRAQAKKIANQSFKQIYLKIAALIHPDREQDEQKKHEKTELLQQANQAYEAKDLFALLALQLQLGQQAKQLADQQLKAYNIMLEEQLEKLTQDIDEIIYSFNWSKRMLSINRKIKVSDLHAQYEQDWSELGKRLKRDEIILHSFKDFQALKELMSSPYMWEMC